jgi:hypothetical protein
LIGEQSAEESREEITEQLLTKPKIFLPRSVIFDSSGVPTRATTIGHRSLVFPQFKIDLPLSMLGYDIEGTQEFALRSKGTGFPVPDNGLIEILRKVHEAVGDHDYTKFLKTERYNGLTPLTILNRADKFGRIKGGQKGSYVLGLPTREFPVRAAPFLYTAISDMELVERLESITEKLGLFSRFPDGPFKRKNTEKVGQEYQLIPSVLRLEDFVSRGHISFTAMLVNKIAPTTDEQTQVRKNYLEDIAEYLGVVSKTAKNHSEGFNWSFVGDIGIGFNTDTCMRYVSGYAGLVDRAINKRELSMRLLGKDIVVAKRLWFVDGESYHENFYTEGYEKFREQQLAYLVNIFRDFSAFLIRFDSACQYLKNEYVTKDTLEKRGLKVIEDLCSIFQEKGYIEHWELKKTERGKFSNPLHAYTLELDLKYQQIQIFDNHYTIPLTYVMP